LYGCDRTVNHVERLDGPGARSTSTKYAAGKKQKTSLRDEDKKL